MIRKDGYVTIGGVEQWLQIRGEDSANPVLLVVHGGPGSPYSVFTPVLREWEREFTVVHWDRRGAGRTRRRNGKATEAELTFDQMVADGIEVSEHLQREFGGPIVLMAGSMGTIIGLPMILRRPELFAAYVGTDFYVNMVENERIGRRDAIERLRAAGNKRGVAALEKIGDDPGRWTVGQWGTRMQWSMATDPVSPNVIFKLIFPLLLRRNPDYSLIDAWNWLRGFSEGRDTMFEQFMRFDARALGTRFEVPFYLFQGAQDVVTVTAPAVEYFNEIEAPTKELVLIDRASHFCAFTQPAAFLAALKRIPVG
jgi:pimeloyl-ACP methyl ester carboxylesterase